MHSVPSVSMARSCIAAAALCLYSFHAAASEGGLGRPVTGVQGASFSGLVPPTPGWNLQISYLHYSSEISGQREVPIAGQVSLGLDASLDMASATGIYIWDTGQGRWNFASMATLPWIGIDARAELQAGQARAALADSASGLFDAFFAPVIASRHIDEMRHVSLALYIYAPTGGYEAGRLANPGLNTWTFSPTVGYTRLFAQGSVEWSTTTAIDFYTRNDATDYRNGAVLRVDSLAIKRLASGWGFGAAGGWIQQVQDDHSALTPGGFRGRALALGPIATYASKWEGGQVEFSARWLKEFNVRNRLSGEPLTVSAAIQF